MSPTIVNLSLTLLLIVGAAYAAVTSDGTTSDEVDRNSVAPSSSTVSHTPNNELSSLPGNLLSMLANGGTLVAGLLALAAMAMLVMPLFGFRMCSILGGCDPYQAYYNNDAYNSAGYGQSPLYTSSTYQKRSLEYIGPILKALSSAYDKYGKMNAAPTTTTKKS